MQLSATSVLLAVLPRPKVRCPFDGGWKEAAQAWGQNDDLTGVTVRRKNA